MGRGTWEEEGPVEKRALNADAHVHLETQDETKTQQLQTGPKALAHTLPRPGTTNPFSSTSGSIIAAYTAMPVWCAHKRKHVSVRPCAFMELESKEGETRIEADREGGDFPMCWSISDPVPVGFLPSTFLMLLCCIVEFGNVDRKQSRQRQGLPGYAGDNFCRAGGAATADITRMLLGFAPRCVTSSITCITVAPGMTQ